MAPMIDDRRKKIIMRNLWIMLLLAGCWILSITWMAKHPPKRTELSPATAGKLDAAQKAFGGDGDKR